MRKLTRRTVTRAFAICAASGLSAGGASAADFTYKLANNLPASHPMNVRLGEAAAAIKTETNGAFELQIFPSSQLGSDTDTLGQIRNGSIDFFMLSGLILSTLVPIAAINGVGFAFDGYDTVWKAMDGAFGGFIREEIARSRQIIAMEKIWDNGFRQTTTATRPILKPADFEGMKLRVPPAPLLTSMFKAFGAAPVTINFNETYSALQTHVVDGEENPLAVIDTAKLHEVQKYCSTTNHMWDGFWLLANRRNWEALPEAMRAIVARRLNAAAMDERADVLALNNSLRETLAGKGMIFNDVEPAAFRDKLRTAGFYAEWKQKFGDAAWDRLETAVGKLS